MARCEPSLNQMASKTTPIGSTYSYSYDSYGRLTQVTNPGSTVQTISYDDVNNVKTVTDENGHFKSFAYDWNNRLTSVKEYYSSTSYYLTSYPYDQLANLFSVTDAKNNVTSYQYDDLNRLTKTTFPDAAFETCTYDNVRNLLTRTDPRSNQMSYTYDGTGNVPTINTQSYSYDWLDGLTSSSYTGGWGTITYGYDAVGNRVSKVEGEVTTSYTYGSFNRLTQAGSTTYTYDANGLRIAEMVGSTVYYYHQDILGSIRLLSTSTPVATQFSSNYLPYGPNYGSSGTEVFQYAGKPQDSITGYYNFGARYYDPTVGRFITQDSYSGEKEIEVVPEKVIYSKKVRMHS